MPKSERDWLRVGRCDGSVLLLLRSLLLLLLLADLSSAAANACSDAIYGLSM